MTLGIPERDTRRRHVPEWDGGKLGGRRVKSIWPQLAQFLCEHQVDVPGFLQVRFRLSLPRIPDPREIITDMAVSKYRCELREAASKARIQLQSDRTTLRTAMHSMQAHTTTPDELMRVTLAAEHVQLSALFRHLEAARIGFEELAADTREAACGQYQRQRDAYNQAWPRDLLEPLRTVWPFSPEATHCIPNLHATPPRV
jgi:hypothetical protein